MLHAGVAPRKGQKVAVYRTRRAGKGAMTAIILDMPYWIKWLNLAKQLTEKYRTHYSVPYSA